jgi:hypothetical protein
MAADDTHGPNFSPPLILGLALGAATFPAGAAEWTERQPAGPYVLELRVSPRAKAAETPFVVTVTRTDGTPVATVKASGRARFSSGRLKGVATLHPDGENRMKGYGLMSAKPDLRVEVTLSLPGEPAREAAFAPKPARD